MKGISLLVLLFAIVQLSVAQNNTAILKDTGSGSYLLGREMEFFKDASGTLNFEQALQQDYQPVKTVRPNFGYTAGAVWVKVKVINKRSEDRFILHINQAVLDGVVFYQLSTKGTLLGKTVLGESIPYSQRVYKDPYLMAEFHLPTDSASIILLRIQSEEQISVPVYISTPLEHFEMAGARDLLFGAYFGLIVVMMLYNLFIYLTTRDKSYLLYVFYILLVGITQACLEGYAYQYLWPENPWLASKSVYIFTSALCVMAIIFQQHFLQTKTYSPKLHKLSYVVFILFAIALSANLISVTRFSHTLTQILVGLTAVFIIVTSTDVYRKGYRPAKYFLIAWFVLVVGIVIYVFKDAGLLPSTLFTNYTMQIGTAIEVILLAFALADRINILKKDKELANHVALQISQENEKIIREQNVLLEEKVRARTAALEEANDNLSTTITNLKDTQAQLVDAEKMASLGQLTAGIAHEINNPINFVSGNVTPLREDIAELVTLIEKYEELKAGQDQTEVLKQIELYKESIDLPYLKEEITNLLNGITEGAKRTAEIVRGLKNFSRLDEAEFKEANLNEGIETTLILLRNSIKKSTTVKLELGEIPRIECYPGKLNQVLMNIINNAVQAMNTLPADHKKELLIKTFTEGENLVISIKDTGPGMTDEVKNKIFEPFFTTKPVGEGTGLGLSIVFKIIKTHAGTISVNSTLGSGTEFIIKLPLKSPL